MESMVVLVRIPIQVHIEIQWFLYRTGLVSMPVSLHVSHCRVNENNSEIGQVLRKECSSIAELTDNRP